MSPTARLHAAFDLLDDLERSGRAVDAGLSAWFRHRRFIGGRDRAAIVDLVYATLRHRARLDWWLVRLGRPATARHRLLAWLVLGEGATPDRLRALLERGDASRPATVAAERALLSALEGHTIDHPAMPEEVRLECPPWAADALRHRFGDAFGREMAACLVPPPLDLRVNSLKTTRDGALRALRASGLSAEATRRAPHGIRVPHRPAASDLPLLASGEVEIQDEGSQLVASLLGARAGERVVDFCAGAGGKTLAIGAQMANKGRVVACDISEGRLKRAAERFRRAGLHNVETRLLASETDRWVKRHKGGFDRVLVDAPCSGTGTWRRNPDARWREGGSGLDTLLPLQTRILASASRLVKPGGRLVYATCSLLPQENEAQIEAFLAAHPGFRLVPLREAAPELADLTRADSLSLTPARHGTDGFFAAVMERDAASP